MNNRTKSFIAEVDLAEHTAVKFGTDGKVTKAAAATDNVIGVTEFSAKAGKTVDVVLLGISYLQVTGSCNFGDLLVAAADGKASVLDVENSEGAVTVIGKTLESATESAYINTFINPVPLIIPTTEAEETNETQKGE